MKKLIFWVLLIVGILLCTSFNTVNANTYLYNRYVSEQKRMKKPIFYPEYKYKKAKVVDAKYSYYSMKEIENRLFKKPLPEKRLEDNTKQSKFWGNLYRPSPERNRMLFPVPVKEVK